MGVSYLSSFVVVVLACCCHVAFCQYSADNTDHTSLQAAVTAVSSGGEIIIADGTTAAISGIYINKPMTIKAAEGATVLLYAPSTVWLFEIGQRSNTQDPILASIDFTMANITLRGGTGVRAGHIFRQRKPGTLTLDHVTTRWGPFIDTTHGKLIATGCTIKTERDGMLLASTEAVVAGEPTYTFEDTTVQYYVPQNDRRLEEEELQGEEEDSEKMRRLDTASEAHMVKAMITVSKGSMKSSGSTYRDTKVDNENLNSIPITAVKITSAVVHIFTDDTFEANGGDKGGSSWIISGAQATFTRCAFSESIARTEGGAVYVQAGTGAVAFNDCSFKNCKCGSGDRSPYWIGKGGAIAAYRKITISGGDDNTGCATVGGSLSQGAFFYFAPSASGSTVENVELKKGDAFGRGGGISTETDLTIKGVIFEGCNAIYGGGVFFTNPEDQHATLMIDGSAKTTAFRRCTARYGPGLFDNATHYTDTNEASDGASDITIKSIEMTSNSVKPGVGGAVSPGAAIRLEGYGSFTLSGTSTCKFHTRTSGACIYSTRYKTHISDLTATGNTANYGILLHFEQSAIRPYEQPRKDSRDVDVLISDVSVSANSNSRPARDASNEYGQILHIIAQGGTITIQDSSFQGHSSSNGKGAEIFVDNGVKNSTAVSAQSLFKLKNVAFTSVGSKTAVRITSAYPQHIENVSFRDNTSKDCTSTERDKQVWEEACGGLVASPPLYASYYGCGQTCATTRDWCDTAVESPKCVPSSSGGGSFEEVTSTISTTTTTPTTTTNPTTTTSSTPSSSGGAVDVGGSAGGTVAVVDPAKPSGAPSISGEAAVFAKAFAEAFVAMKAFHSLLYYGQLADLGPAGSVTIFAFKDGHGTDGASTSAVEAKAYLRNHIVNEELTMDTIKTRLNASVKVQAKTKAELAAEAEGGAKGQLIAKSDNNRFQRLERRSLVVSGSTSITLTTEARATGSVSVSTDGGSEIVFTARESDGVLLANNVVVDESASTKMNGNGRMVIATEGDVVINPPDETKTSGTIMMIKSYTLLIAILTTSIVSCSAALR